MNATAKDPVALEAGRSKRLLAFCFSEGNKPVGFLVPKDEFDAAQALHKGDAADIAQLGMVAQHFGKAVIGHPARQMMHMMDADIAGKPSQHQR